MDLDPWGLQTGRSWNSQLQPRKYTTYERDGNQSDEAMMRRYNRWHLRFDQPDPADFSYDLGDPQSFNRYSYTNCAGVMNDAWTAWRGGAARRLISNGAGAPIFRTF